MVAWTLYSYLICVPIGLLVVVKLWTTSWAIVWLQRHGRNYKRALEKQHPVRLTGARLRKLLSEHGGRLVKPWGVLEFTRFDMPQPWPFIAGNLFRLPYMIAAGFFFFLIIFFWGDLGPAASLWASIAVLCQFAVTLTVIEGLTAYITVGSYRRHYHAGVRLPGNKRVNQDNATFELVTMIPLFVVAVVSNVFLFLSIEAATRAFESGPIYLDPTDQWGTFVQALYFVSSTMSTVGYGDIHPRTLLGEGATILIQVQSVLLVVGIIGAMLTFGFARHRENQ